MTASSDDMTDIDTSTGCVKHVNRWGLARRVFARRDRFWASPHFLRGRGRCSLTLRAFGPNFYKNPRV